MANANQLTLQRISPSKCLDLGSSMSLIPKGKFETKMVCKRRSEAT